MAGEGAEQTVGPAGRLLRRLGGPRLASAILLDALGSGTVMPLSVLFFTVHQHMAATTVGIALSIGGVVALVLGPFGGQLMDRIGPRRTLLCTWPASAALAAIWPLIHGLGPLAALESATALFGGLGWNATTLLLVNHSDETEVSRVMAAQYSLKNFGFGAGGLLATLALAIGGIGFDLAVWANALSFLIGALLAAGVGPGRSPAAVPEHDDTTLWTVIRDRRYVGLALLNSLIAFNQVGLSVLLPLWVVLDTHAPRALVGLLYTLNTLMVVSGQLTLSGRVRALSDTPRAYLIAALAMAAATGAYLLAHVGGAALAVVLLVLGTVLLTLTEMFASACSFLVSIELADPLHRGKYLSVFGIGWGIENSAGPTAGTGLLGASTLLAWPAIGAIVVSGALGSAWVLARTRLVPEEAPGLTVR